MKILGTVIKSPIDKRTYRAIKLHNQIQCLIVSDEQAQKSSAALSVGVGSLMDPIDAQGLAHYLEHMLFMGTEKYPEENDYMNFISKNFGYSNAYTSQSETNFHFEVASSAFVPALDRFAQFFICPLMLDSSSERQLNAVDSEHSKNLQSDSWRKYHMKKHLSKQGHPFSKFSTGDKTSLSNPNLRKMLFDFYNSNYSSNLMKLVVQGKESVEQLSKIVENLFSAIPNKNYKPYKMIKHPFDQKIFKKMVKIVPVKDRRTIELTWILSDQSIHYRNPPSRYVGYVLGHEGKGSLISYLISEGLANGLTCDKSDSFGCYSEFNFYINLTDKGFENIQRVIGHVLYAVQTLKTILSSFNQEKYYNDQIKKSSHQSQLYPDNLYQRQEPQRWIFEEVKHINKMNFDFMDKSQGINFVSNLAKDMHEKPSQEIIYYPYLMEEWTPELIKSYLNQMTTDNLICICQNQKYEPECTEVQPIYKTKFTTTNLSNVQPIPWSFYLPEKNTFIPQDFTVLPLGMDQYPIFLKSQHTPNIEPFYKKDHRFSLPKVQVNLRFYSDGHNSVKEDVCQDLFEEMLREHLREFTYYAQTAGINSQLYFTNFFTMVIKVDGFRDTFIDFMTQYIPKIFDFEPNDKNLFQNLKQSQTKAYSNNLLKMPYELAYDSLLIGLKQGSANTPQKKLEMISSVSFEDVKRYASSWRKKIYSQILISGNLEEKTAKQITKGIKQAMAKYSQTFRRQDIPTIRPVLLPFNQLSIVEQELDSKQETNSSVIVYFQFETFQVRTNLILELAQNFIREPAFDYLRTKQQLGYTVMSYSEDIRGILGMEILVQSNVKNSHQLAQYIDIFLDKILRENIDKLTEEEFNVFKSALLNTKMQKDKDLSDECSRFSHQIFIHCYQFDLRKQQIDTLPTITLQEFKSFLKKHMYENVRRFEMHKNPKSLLGSNEQTRKKRVETNPSIRVYSDIVAFRNKMQLLPDIYSHAWNKYA